MLLLQCCNDDATWREHPGLYDAKWLEPIKSSRSQKTYLRCGDTVASRAKKDRAAFSLQNSAFCKVFHFTPHFNDHEDDDDDEEDDLAPFRLAAAGLEQQHLHQSCVCAKCHTSSSNDEATLHVGCGQQQQQ